MKDFRLRGGWAVGVVAGLLMWSFAGALSGALGGTPDAEQNGIFYLSSHGTLTEVSPHTWQIMGYVEWLIPAGWCTMVASSLLCLLAHNKRKSWYESRADYSVVILVVLVFGMLMILTGDAIGPRP